MQTPIISYISAVYNKADVLLETLNCLRHQKHIDAGSVEFVFSDDCSTDGSRDLLQAEMQRDPRIKLIENTVNAGPAIRINQAADIAVGTYFLPVDADDLLPANATSFLVNCAHSHKVPLVFGQSKRGTSCPEINENTSVSLVDDALAYCARKTIVHMGFLVEASIWRQAQGANPEIFIQDQSLPLRLSAEAQKLAYINDVIYWLRPAGDGNLSKNVAQQHHDRFFSARPLLDHPNTSETAKKALMRQIISSLWKQHRDAGKPLPHLSVPFVRYLLNRVISSELSDVALARVAADMLALPNIRRPGVDA